MACKGVRSSREVIWCLDKENLESVASSLMYLIINTKD